MIPKHLRTIELVAKRHVAYVAVALFALLIAYGLLASFEILPVPANTVPAVITALAVVSSALWASWFASHAIANQRLINEDSQSHARDTARLRATLDFILKTELDEQYIEAKRVWKELRAEDEQQVTELLARVHYSNAAAKEIDKAAFVRTLYNNFELAALAIDQGILDEEFYFEWYASTFILTWNQSAYSIGVMRALLSNANLYIQWEQMVTQWAKRKGSKHVARAPDFGTKELVRLAGLRSTTRQTPPDDPDTGSSLIDTGANDAEGIDAPQPG
ncbi:MAG: DUF4760 domain-containing protein [Hyphomicrobiaceae bacterium]